MATSISLLALCLCVCVCVCASASLSRIRNLSSQMLSCLPAVLFVLGFYIGFRMGFVFSISQNAKHSSWFVVCVYMNRCLF